MYILNLRFCFNWYESKVWSNQSIWLFLYEKLKRKLAYIDSKIYILRSMYKLEILYSILNTHFECKYACAYPHAHIYIYTYTHTYRHTNTHTHTHKSIRPLFYDLGYSCTFSAKTNMLAFDTPKSLYLRLFNTTVWSCAWFTTLSITPSDTKTNPGAQRTFQYPTNPSPTPATRPSS